jgi:hypothetical protein
MGFRGPLVQIQSSRPGILGGNPAGGITPFPIFYRPRFGAFIYFLLMDYGVPLKFCSFTCERADNDKAQHAACLAVNGVFCGILHRVVEKGMPCPAGGIQKSHLEKAKEAKKKDGK